jgi:hypothetical protein
MKLLSASWIPIYIREFSDTVSWLEDGGSLSKNRALQQALRL